MNPRNYPDIIQSAESGRPLYRAAKRRTVMVDGELIEYNQPGWWAAPDDPHDNEGQLIDEDNMVRADARQAGRPTMSDRKFARAI